MAEPDRIPADRCPDCRRRKAVDIKDCRRGDCPKWYMIRDPGAELDCFSVRDRIEQERYAVIGGPSSPPPDAVRAAHEALNPPKSSDRIPADVLAKLEETVAAMTLGEWRQQGSPNDHRVNGKNGPVAVASERFMSRDERVANARGIAMLRNHASLLIAAAKREAALAETIEEMECAATEQITRWRMERTSYYELKAELAAAREIIERTCDAPLKLEILQQRSAAVVAEAVKLLEPFAEYAERNLSVPDGYVIGGPGTTIPQPTIGDCRAAAAFVQRHRS